MIELHSGIYTIVNKRTQKIYVGSSKNIVERIATHKRALRRGDHANYQLQSDYNGYGDVFDYSVLEYCEESALRHREQHWIDVFGGFASPNTYNLLDTKTVSAEVVEKRRQGMVGKTRSDEFKQKMSGILQGNKRNLGKKLSESAKKKIGENSRAHLTGSKQSEETKNKRAESLRRYWADVKAGRKQR